MAGRQRQEKAAMAKDINGVRAALKDSLTPDFKFVQGGKSMNLKSFIDNFTMTVTMMDKITASSSRIVSLTERGNKGSGRVEIFTAGTMKNQDKKTHKINWTGAFTEEYRKVGGKWKIASMVAGAQKFLVDGKPAKM